MTTKIPAELSSTPGISDSSDATAITITSSEQVGIGTTSPVATLQVKTQTDGNLAFQNSTSVTGGVKLNCFNDAANASSPFEIDGSSLQFNIASSIKARIDSDGLKFGSDTAAANALDDYEEGLHTVSMTDSGGGATITLNTSFNQLSYTKIGRIVQISGVLLPSAVSGSFTGTTVISLPFAAADLSDQAGKGFINVETYSVDFTAGTSPAGHIGEGTSTASILVSADNAGYGFARVSTSSQIYVGGTYITSS